MTFYYITFLLLSIFSTIFTASLFEECAFTADCKVGMKPACVNIGNKNYCIEQCDEGEDLYQCGAGKKCKKSLDIDGTTINSCAYEINCLTMNQCTKQGEICSPYSFTCVPASLLPSQTTYKPTQSTGNNKICVDKGFINGAYSCSVISDLCNQPKYKEFMEEYCSKTCGFCKDEQIDCNSTSCKDTFEVKLRKELTAFIRVPPNF